MVFTLDGEHAGQLARLSLLDGGDDGLTSARVGNGVSEVPIWQGLNRQKYSLNWRTKGTFLLQAGLLFLVAITFLNGWSFQETDPLSLGSTSQALGGRDALQSGSRVSQSIAQLSPSNIGLNV